jgi:hypothetical protein
MTLESRKDYIANKQHYIQEYMNTPVCRPTKLTIRDYINAIKYKLFT